MDELTKTLIPMIRRAVPRLIASEIAGVQPMAGPKVISTEEVEEVYTGYAVFCTDNERFIRYEDFIGGSHELTYVFEAEANIFLRADDVFFIEDGMGKREEESFIVVAASKTKLVEVPVYEGGKKSAGGIFSLRVGREIKRTVDFNQRWTWQQFKEEFD